MDGESTLSGTLRRDSTPVAAANICILDKRGVRLNRTVTNDLGEYALSVHPGIYEVEIQVSKNEKYRSQIDISTPGLYRDRLKIGETKK